MHVTTRRRAVSILATSAVAAGLGITTLVSPAIATTAPGLGFAPSQVKPLVDDGGPCGWRPGANSPARSTLIHLVHIRNGNHIRCPYLADGRGRDHVTVHCSWLEPGTGPGTGQVAVWWDYLHDDERLTTGWVNDLDVLGPMPVSTGRC